MKKLLHERLREIADEKEGELYSSDIIEALCKEFGVCENKSSYGVDLCNCLKAIADEIEKYYIPRPRFKDGEPVQFGDYVDGCNSPVDSFLIYEDGSGTVYGEDDLPYNVDDGAVTHIYEPHKRPKPKMLDADGVEIKVGDTIYSTQTGVKLTVIEIVNQNGHNLRVRFDDGTMSYAMGNLYTHREPDSLEKLRDDMLEIDAPVGTITAGKWADRITALIERGA